MHAKMLNLRQDNDWNELETQLSVVVIESRKMKLKTANCDSKQERKMKEVARSQKVLKTLMQTRIPKSRKRKSSIKPQSKIFFKTSLLIFSTLILHDIVLTSIHCQTTTQPALDSSSSLPNVSVDLADITTAPIVPIDELDGNHYTSNNTIQQNKLKPVNFTLVDEIFESVLSEDEVVKRWKHMDSQLQDGMKSILKMLFPQIVSISQDAKVSGECSGGILKWILSLRNLRSWSIKMLDASGKPTSGIFQGSLTMFGNYRQCLNIRAPDEDEIEITDQFEEYFRGQFCVIHLKPWMPVKRPFYHLNSTIDSLLRKNYKYYEKTLYDELAEIAIAFNFINIRMDLCVPSTCTVADIQRVAELLSKKMEMRAKVMRCDIAPRETNLFSNIERSTYFWIAIPLLLITISLISTILVGLRIGSQAKHVQASFSNRSSKVALILQSLSINGALKDRLTMPESSKNSFEDYSGSECESNADQMTEQRVFINFHKKPLPLYGLRNLFIFWFIVVQMTMELKYQYLRESLTLRNMIISYWPFQIIVNSSLLFESLLVITAFTYSYTCMESTLKDIVGYLVDKYVRLILSIITLIALTIVTPLIAIESPVWRNFVEEQSTVCKSTGYIDLFFLQNFISYDKICLPHTWLFCVEMQLIVLSIPLILLLKKNFLSTEDSVIIGRSEQDEDKKGSICLLKVALHHLLCSKAGILSSIFILVGFFINFFTVYTNQLPPSWFYTFPDVAQKNYYFGHYLTKTWTHLSVFVIGLLAGHLCRSTLQLRQIRLLKAQQSRAEPIPQPSPAPSGSTNQSNLASRQSHGSTSTIMAMEQGSQQTDDNSSSSGHSANRKAERQLQLTRVSYQLAALVSMAAIIFSTFSWSTQEAPSTLVAALYDASSRIIWSLALVVLMIQLCLPELDTNKYSLVGRLLCHPMCTLLGRLSFLAYLLSPYVHTFVLAVEEQSLFPSLFIIFHIIVGNIVITYVLAFILAIVIEQPVRRLISRFVLGKRYCRQKLNISTYYANATDSIPTISLPLKPDS